MNCNAVCRWNGAGDTEQFVSVNAMVAHADFVTLAVSRLSGAPDRKVPLSPIVIREGDDGTIPSPAEECPLPAKKFRR